jgi:hypothetical protein
MADATCGRSIPLPAIGSGFGLNEKAVSSAILSGTYRITSLIWNLGLSGNRIVRGQEAIGMTDLRRFIVNRSDHKRPSQVRVCAASRDAVTPQDV